MGRFCYVYQMLYGARGALKEGSHMNSIVPAKLLPFVEGAHLAVHRMQTVNSPVRQQLEEDHRRGGFLCVADLQGRPLLIQAIGKPSDEKWDACLEFCEEKVRRLGMHPDHYRGWESRNLELLHYGGALRGERHLASFSGFPEGLDEVVAGAALYKGNDLCAADLLHVLADNSFVASHGAEWVNSLLF